MTLLRITKKPGGYLLLYAIVTLALIVEQNHAERECKAQYSGLKKIMPHLTHNACTDKSSKSSPIGDLIIDKDDIVNEHNKLRGQVEPPATNMFKMRYDDELAHLAQRWAEHCGKGHGANEARYLMGIYGETVGQNIMYHGAKGSFKDMINGWFNEYKNYDHASNKGIREPYGHYLQMVWAETRRVGCGAAKCGSNYVYVCNYAPILRSGYKPYRNGTSCKNCPNNCKDNLCVCENECYNHAKMKPGTCGCECLSGAPANSIDCSMSCEKKEPWYCKTSAWKSCDNFDKWARCPQTCKQCEYLSNLTVSLGHSCDVSPAPANGGSSVSEETVPYGTTVHYQCDPGFWAIGSTMRTCLESGQLSGTPLQCVNEGCPEGWVALANQGKCYQVFQDKKMTFDESQAKCKELGGQLAMPNTQEADEAVSAAKDAAVAGPVWIGLTDRKNEGTFLWVDGQSLSYTKWSDGEPNNLGNKEDCAIIAGNGNWKDKPCHYYFYYMCQLDFQVPKGHSCDVAPAPANGGSSVSEETVPHGTHVNYQCDPGFWPVGSTIRTCLESGQLSGTAVQCVKVDCPEGWVMFAPQGKCYQVFQDQKMNYDESQAKCKELGGQLAMPNTQEADDAVSAAKDANVDQGPVWIGLTDRKKEGTFLWEDGQSLSYTKWSNGQPDNLGNNEDCAIIGGDGDWKDKPCHYDFYYMCQVNFLELNQAP